MTRTDVDALARLLDGDPTLNGEATEDTRALGRLAHVLAAARPAPARPEFKAELRATLLTAARDGAPARPLLGRLRRAAGATAARWRYSARLTAATGAAALALSSGGVAVSAHRAMPSDALYPAKLVLEDVRIALVRDDVTRGTAHLTQSANRMDEAATVASGGDQVGAARALHKADESARVGARELLRAYLEDGQARYVELLAAFTDSQRLRLSDLDRLLVGDAAEAASRLAIALERIEARMASLTGSCPACPGGMPADGVGFDFSYIPPADEDFAACPCVVAPSGNDPAPVDSDEPADVDADADPGAPGVVGLAPPLVEDVPPPATDTPTVDSPAPVSPPAGEYDPRLPRPERPDPDAEPGVRLPELPEVREPLRDGFDRLIDGLIRGVTGR